MIDTTTALCGIGVAILAQYAKGRVRDALILLAAALFIVALATSRGWIH